MTREEAIKILKEERWYMSRYSEEYKEAYDIAIKALQGDMYCPSCGVRLVPENEYVEPKPDKEGDK